MANYNQSASKTCSFAYANVNSQNTALCYPKKRIYDSSFFMVDNKVIPTLSYNGFSSSQILVYMYFMSLRPNEPMFLNITAISNYCGLSRNTARDAIQKLEEYGFLAYNGKRTKCFFYSDQEDNDTGVAYKILEKLVSTENELQNEFDSNEIPFDDEGYNVSQNDTEVLKNLPPCSKIEHTAQKFTTPDINDENEGVLKNLPPCSKIDHQVFNNLPPTAQKLTTLLKNLPLTDQFLSTTDQLFTTSNIKEKEKKENIKKEEEERIIENDPTALGRLGLSSPDGSSSFYDTVDEIEEESPDNELQIQNEFEDEDAQEGFEETEEETSDKSEEETSDKSEETLHFPVDRVNEISHVWVDDTSWMKQFDGQSEDESDEPESEDTNEQSADESAQLIIGSYLDGRKIIRIGEDGRKYVEPDSFEDPRYDYWIDEGMPKDEYRVKRETRSWADFV